MDKHNISSALTTIKDYPCRTCTDRYVGCHATCEKYIQARKEQDEANEAKYQSRKSERIIRNLQVEGAMRTINRKR